MVFETVHTGGRTIRDCLTAMDRATRNLGMADNNQDDKEVMKYYDAMSTWSHTLGAAILNLWLVRIEKIRKNFPARAKQIGAERAGLEIESIIGYYQEFADAFSRSEKTSKYASLNLQHAGKKVKRRLKRILRNVNREKNRLTAQEKMVTERKIRAEEQKKRKQQRGANIVDFQKELKARKQFKKQKKVA